MEKKEEEQQTTLVREIIDLIDHGTNPNIAKLNEALDQLKDINEHRVPCTNSDAGLCSILHYALLRTFKPYVSNSYVYGGGMPVIKTLLEHGADPNVRNIERIYSTFVDQHGAHRESLEVNNGNTPLIDAVLRKRCDEVKLLLDYGADPNIKEGSSRGYTPIMLAASGPHHYFGNLCIVTSLLRAGADITQKSPSGKNLIDLAEDKPEVQMVIEGYYREKEEEDLKRQAILQEYLHSGMGEVGYPEELVDIMVSYL